MAVLPRVIYKISTVPPEVVREENDSVAVVLKLTWKEKGVRMTKTAVKKATSKVLMQLDSRH